MFDGGDRGVAGILDNCGGMLVHDFLSRSLFDGRSNFHLGTWMPCGTCFSARPGRGSPFHSLGIHKVPMSYDYERRPGFVYFVQETELRRIKIGFTSSHPVKRLSTLSNASSQVL